MGKLIVGALLLFVASLIRLARVATGGAGSGRPSGGILRAVSYGFLALGIVLVLFSTAVVIAPGAVGVQHYFGYVNPHALLPGIRFVYPWSSIERFSTREEQWPETSEQVEQIAALSSEQMGMTVEVSIRWQIDPQQAPRIFTEIGNEDQIRGALPQRDPQRRARRDGAVLDQRHLPAHPHRDHDGVARRFLVGHAAPRGRR